jgi:PIN domain nuclease of toxin-antitoxin system
MRYLLDTNVWLWSLGPTEKIGREGLEVVSSGEQEIFLSVASSWEIALKTQLGKFSLPEEPIRFVSKRLTQQGIRPLPITLSHSLKVFDLPLHHGDPFDRMIIGQAITEEMTVLTSDRLFEKYSVNILWCGK